MLNKAKIVGGMDDRLVRKEGLFRQEADLALSAITCAVENKRARTVRYDFMERLTLIYDGECPFCRRAAAWALQHARANILEILPCQNEERERRFPEITRAQCMAAMQLVMPDGRVYSGEDALPPLMERMKGWHWVARVLRWPGIRHVSPAAYRWFANHRYALAAIAGHKHTESCSNGVNKPCNEGRDSE
jgi:predicted DCC family thiol-disulfide oxidoreductase YuxK